MIARGSYAVRDLLLARRAANSRPGARRDGAILALVVAGGGMRGVVAGGMVTALERLGLLDAFDILCGTSSGAFAVCYFGAGQAALGARIYAEDLSDRRFIDVRRLLSGLPVMDLDYLVDRVAVASKPLDTAALLRHPARLLLMATDAATAEPRALSDFRSGDAVRNALRASARMPLIAGPPVPIGGRALIDGALGNAMPADAAAAAGATHALLLANSPFRRSDDRLPGITARLFAARLSQRYGETVRHAFEGRAAAYAAVTSALADGRLAAAPGRPAVALLGLAPDPASSPLSRICTDAKCLRAGAAEGERVVDTVFT